MFSTLPNFLRLWNIVSKSLVLGQGCSPSLEGSTFLVAVNRVMLAFLFCPLVFCLLGFLLLFFPQAFCHEGGAPAASPPHLSLQTCVKKDLGIVFLLLIFTVTDMKR